MVMIYDGIIMLGLLMIASLVVLPLGGAGKVAFQDFWFTVWLLSVCFIYLTACWHKGGLTVGMRAWRVQLVTENSDRLSWARSAVRFMVGLVSILVLGLGFIWALIDKKNRSWHDLAAGTVLQFTPKDKN